MEGNLEEPITEEMWNNHVINTTQILDILNLQFSNFWTDVQPAMYLYYRYETENISNIERIAVLLGEELEAVEKIESKPEFSRWLTRTERLEIEKYTQQRLFGYYTEGIQI